MVSANKSTWYPTTFTLGTGVRVTNITVTTTGTSLESLLNTAVSGRTSMGGRRSLKLLNMDGTATFYITESSTQGATSGWPVLAGATFSADGSETFTQNIDSLSVANGRTNGGAGLYLRCASGTIAVKVLEAK